MAKAGRPINQSRVEAQVLGDKTYIGVRHRPCGTRVRYVSSGACVECARAKQARMRRLLEKAEARDDYDDLGI